MDSASHIGSVRAWRNRQGLFGSPRRRSIQLSATGASVVWEEPFIPTATTKRLLEEKARKSWTDALEKFSLFTSDRTPPNGASDRTRSGDQPVGAVSRVVAG
jgi:hypothetical protein